MHEYKHYVEAIAGDVEKELSTKEIVCEELRKYKERCPDEYWHMIYKLHCVAFGPHFDELSAKMAVKAMKNVDGSVGEHWNIEQTNSLANQYSIKHYWDWYYALNMLHSDLSAVMGGDANTYAKMAKALYFDDPDAPEGKLFRQWVATHKR